MVEQSWREIKVQRNQILDARGAGIIRRAVENAALTRDQIAAGVGDVVDFTLAGVRYTTGVLKVSDSVFAGAGVGITMSRNGVDPLPCVLGGIGAFAAFEGLKRLDLKKKDEKSPGFNGELRFGLRAGLSAVALDSIVTSLGGPGGFVPAAIEGLAVTTFCSLSRRANEGLTKAQVKQG